MHPSSLLAQRKVNDHMLFHKLQSHKTDITAKMVSHVRQARRCYLNDQRDRSFKKLQSEKDVEMQVLRDDIDDVKKKITIARHHDFSKKNADQHSFEAEEKTKIGDVKSLISKSNALKRAVKEKRTS